MRMQWLHFKKEVLVLVRKKVDLAKISWRSLRNMVSKFSCVYERERVLLNAIHCCCCSSAHPSHIFNNHLSHVCWTPCTQIHTFIHTLDNFAQLILLHACFYEFEGFQQNQVLTWAEHAKLWAVSKPHCTTMPPWSRFKTRNYYNCSFNEHVWGARLTLNSIRCQHHSRT